MHWRTRKKRDVRATQERRKQWRRYWLDGHGRYAAWLRVLALVERVAHAPAPDRATLWRDGVRDLGRQERRELLSFQQGALHGRVPLHVAPWEEPRKFVRPVWLRDHAPGP